MYACVRIRYRPIIDPISQNPVNTNIFPDCPCIGELIFAVKPGGFGPLSIIKHCKYQYFVEVLTQKSRFHEPPFWNDFTHWLNHIEVILLKLIPSIIIHPAPSAWGLFPGRLLVRLPDPDVGGAGSPGERQGSQGYTDRLVWGTVPLNGHSWWFNGISWDFMGFNRDLWWFTSW